MSSTRRTSLLAGAAVLALAAPLSPPVSAQPVAAKPAVRGNDPGYLHADKQGFGTARTLRSNLWFTLGRGGASELYYPNLTTPATRQLQLVVTDGETFVQRLSDGRTRTEPLDAKVPAYRQVSTGQGWRVAATYVTDPARPAMMVRLHVRSLTGRPLQVYAIHEPTLTRDGSDGRGRTVGKKLVAFDDSAAAALRATPKFTRTSSGYLGSSDGWTDLSRDMRMNIERRRAGPGNIGQTGRLAVNGLGRRSALLTLGYGRNRGKALATANRSTAAGFDPTRKSYGRGWKRYVASLTTADSLRTRHQKEVYWSSLVMLAASEDKQDRGGFVASPSMPWAWRNDESLAPVPGPYHLVWPRDLYQHATALLAAGDEPAAHRAWDFLRAVQRPDGHFAQNYETTGEPHWTSIQLDETALPIVLAWQLQRTDRGSIATVRRAVRFLLTYEQDGFRSPWSEQERWENQSGYSPGTIASVIAGLVCAADLMRQVGDHERARRYLAVADRWEGKVDGWTATSNGPYSPRPYYLRLSKEGNPDRGTRYNPGDNYPTEVDQRTQVDPSFLELVRLGIRPADDPLVRNTVRVVDQVLMEQTPAGQFWHRFTSDGYGEKADGRQWNLVGERTYGRLWPIFAGERGEYELLAGQPGRAASRLTAMARTANQGLMLAEQVWDNRPPAADGNPRPGTPTRSATPLAWTHGQYVRLALSLDAGRPVERPGVVVRRYAGR